MRINTLTTKFNRIKFDVVLWLKTIPTASSQVFSRKIVAVCIWYIYNNTYCNWKLNQHQVRTTTLRACSTREATRKCSRSTTKLRWIACSLFQTSRCCLLRVIWAFFYFVVWLHKNKCTWIFSTVKVNKLYFGVIVTNNSNKDKNNNSNNF